MPVPGGPQTLAWPVEHRKAGDSRPDRKLRMRQRKASPLDDSDWGAKLSEPFGHAPRDDAAWSALKERLPIGSTATGRVVARAPFGVWVDIGAGFPALLEVPEIAGARERPLSINDYPAVGSEVVARVVCFRETNRQVMLSQRYVDV
jgi:hypothetical protein